jgi:hypothetical protein
MPLNIPPHLVGKNGLQGLASNILKNMPKVLSTLAHLYVEFREEFCDGHDSQTQNLKSFP